nr:MAG TPA: hypothetical protein [Caudoviricetes sp.]
MSLWKSRVLLSSTFFYKWRNKMHIARFYSSDNYILLV